MGTNLSVTPPPFNGVQGRISNLSGRTRLSLNTRVGGQNLYGPRPSAENCYENARVGDKNLYGPRPNTEFNMTGIDIRSVDIHGNPVSVLPNELNFWGEIDGQNLYGQLSPRGKFNPICGGLDLKQGIFSLPLGLVMNFTRLISLNH